MSRRGFALALGLLLVGCTHIVDNPRPQAQPRVGPIIAAQVGDLLSEHVQDKDGNQFVTVQPESCAGVAREKDAPFIVDHHPAATDGGHWVASGGTQVYVEELVAVYPSDFDATAALAAARHTIESCQGTPFTVTSMKEREYHFTMLPRVQTGTP